MAALRGVDEAHEVNILSKFMVKYFVVGGLWHCKLMTFGTFDQSDEET